MNRNEIKRTIVTSNILCNVYNKNTDTVEQVTVQVKAGNYSAEKLEKLVKKELPAHVSLLKVHNVHNTQKTYYISTEAFIVASEQYMQTVPEYSQDQV